jgi:hypothetical protein
MRMGRIEACAPRRRNQGKVHPMPAPVATWFKAVSWAMAGLLFLCVALQYNDPDPIRWMLMYGAGAVASVLLPIKKPAAALALLVGMVTLAWAFYLIHSVWGLIGISDLTNKMSEKGGAVEVGREAGGLLIQGVWLMLAAAYRGARA